MPEPATSNGVHALARTAWTTKVTGAPLLPCCLRVSLPLFNTTAIHCVAAVAFALEEQDTCLIVSLYQ